MTSLGGALFFTRPKNIFSIILRERSISTNVLVFFHKFFIYYEKILGCFVYVCTRWEYEGIRNGFEHKYEKYIYETEIMSSDWCTRKYERVNNVLWLFDSLVLF